MTATFESLPDDVLSIILDHLSIKQQLQISLVNKFLHEVVNESLFEKVIIIFNNYKPIEWKDYLYKCKNYTIVKSSPYNLELLYAKLPYIRRVMIMDNINGLITNWNSSKFHQLMNKSSIQHVFSLRSLSKIESNIKTLELNLINKGSITSSDDVLKYSSLKFLQRIENLIILTNNFGRLHKLENTLFNSLEGDKLRLKSLVIKTYAGVGTDQENYYFVGSTNLNAKAFQMLNFNSVIAMNQLQLLEISIRQEKFQPNSYWHYQIFKSLFSFFNDFHVIKSSEQSTKEVSEIFGKVLKQDFDFINEFHEWCHDNFALVKPYQIKFPRLKKMGIAIHSATDVFIPLNLVREVISHTTSIEELSLHFNSTSIRNYLFNLQRQDWFKSFYNEIVPNLKFFKDRFCLENLILNDQFAIERIQLKIKQIYLDVTGRYILNFSPLRVLMMLLDNFNNLKLDNQFITSVTLMNNYSPLSSDESITNDYHYESYTAHLTMKQKREIIIRFVKCLKELFNKEQIFDPFQLQNGAQIHLNNITFEVVDNQLVCTL